MLTGLKQKPLIQPTVPSLIGLWHGGFTACRAAMIYAVETDMPGDEFYKVACAQVPIIELIIKECDRFVTEGWGAIPGIHPRSLSEGERLGLSIFRHNVINREAHIASMAELAGSDPEVLESWHESAMHTYRKRPALEQMAKDVCHSLLPLAIRNGVHVVSNVESNRHLTDDCFEDARTVFHILTENGIKYNMPGGNVHISNDGFKIFFQDNGYGMHQNFAARLARGGMLREGRLPIEGSGLGLFTAGNIALKHKWRLEFQSEIDKGTIAELTLNEQSFFPQDRAITAKIGVFELAFVISARQMVESASVFLGARPFQGYRTTENGMIDVTGSPIYAATEFAENLLDRLYKPRK